jgi:hypothetical protein
MSSIFAESELSLERGGNSVGRPTATTVLGRWREIETPAMWFLLLNCLDAALTYIMLMYPRFEHEPTAIEANQMAKFFLDRWGIAGMLAFKFASAVFVCAVVLLIAQKNVQTARRTLMLGTLILFAVVAYSVHLAFGYIHG